jgi:hypothetical protein
MAFSFSQTKFTLKLQTFQTSNKINLAFHHVLYNIKGVENRANRFISQKIYKNDVKGSQIKYKTGKPKWPAC